MQRVKKKQKQKPALVIVDVRKSWDSRMFVHRGVKNEHKVCVALTHFSKDIINLTNTVTIE